MKQRTVEIIVLVLAALASLRFTLYVAHYGLSGYALFAIGVSMTYSNLIAFMGFLRLIDRALNGKKPATTD